MRSVLIVGCGAHGRVLAETVQLLAAHDLIGFADDDPGKADGTMFGFPVFDDWAKSGADSLVVGIGNNEYRAKVFQRLRMAGAEIVSLVHPGAFVSRHARLGMGTVVLAGAVVQSGAEVGANVIVNIGAVVDHDAKVGDHAHLAPNSTVASFGRVGEGELLGHGQVRPRDA